MNRSDFGSVLKEFRTRRGVTQQRLAEQLGMRRNTVGSWERGDFLPQSKGTVLELAKHLHLDDQETRRLLEASLAALAPYWHVPLPRNPYFTGREAVLEALHAQLGVDQAGALTQSSALHGLGGVGKTQIALEYAYRYALEYSAVFWIGAETTESMMSSLLHIAETLQLQEREDRDQQRIIAAVQRWLTTQGQWLVIWDNVEDLEQLQRFLPPARQGAVLLTTRAQALGTLAQGIDLLPLGTEEGRLLLLKRAKWLGSDADREHLQQLAQRLPAESVAAAEVVGLMGGLPLALDQAGAYVEETGCSLAGYLQRYQQQRQQLLDRRGARAGDHPSSVVATLSLACQRVAQRSPAALEILCFCAWVTPEAIPEELLVAGASPLGSGLGPIVADPGQLDQALEILLSLSLVQRQAETQTLSLHRLVQVVLQEAMGAQERARWQQHVLHRLHALFPDVTAESSPDIWKQCERLLPHVLSAAAAIPDEAAGREGTELLWKAADYLRVRAQGAQAEPLYARAVRLGEQLWGPEHVALAYPLTGWATLCREQGQFERAQPLYERAWQIREQALGPEHPLVAHPLNGLAALYANQGKPEQAELLYQRALHIWEQALGPAHPLVANPLNGLAILAKGKGDYPQAASLYQRALRIWEQALGPEHPQVARWLYNLAHLHQLQGNFAQAEPLYERSLRIAEQAWGPDHPNVAHPLHGLAMLYQEQGKEEQAAALLERELYLLERTWGPEHELAAYPLHQLALLAKSQGQYEQAEGLFQRALRIAEQVWGSAHPQVAHPLTGLADLYTALGNDVQAEALYERARCIREQTLGETHPDLAATLHGLATLYLGQGKEAQAESLYQRALQIQEQHLGVHHPETAHTLHDLAILRQKQGDLVEAQALAERTLYIRLQALGELHPHTVATRELYAHLVQAQACAGGEAAAESRPEANPDPRRNERHADRASSPLHKAVPPALSEDDSLQEFLDACCELHPRAWCRSAELWQAYQQWIEQQQQHYPLSRRTFTAQLKRRGCRADRTKTARIWRGIALGKRTMTKGDGW